MATSRKKQNGVGRLPAKTGHHDEQHLLAMIQAAPSLMFGADAKGRCTFASDQWYAYTGLTVEETVGWGWTRALPPEDVEIAKAQWAEVVHTGEPFETKGRLRAKDGSYRWFLFRAVPRSGREGSVVGWTGSLTEIDELVRTEEALRASQEFSERLLASSHDCIKVLDLDAKLLVMAEGGRRLMEIEDVTPYLHQPYLNFWDKKDWPAVKEALAAALGGGVGRFEGYSPSVTGKPRWWDARVTPIRGADGRPERLLVIARDVTEAKQAREELLRSEHRYRQLINVLPIAVYTCDAEGHVQLYNQKAAELWGRHPKVGEDFWCGSLALSSADGTALAHQDCAMAVALRESRGVHGPETIVERPDGSRVNVMPYVELFQDQWGGVAGAVNVMMDITAIRQAEEALRKGEERLRMANEAGRIGTYEYDRRIHRTLLSPEMCAILGVPPGYSQTPDRYLDFIHEEDRQSVRDAIARAGEPWADGISRLELRVVRPTGELRWVSWSAHTFFGETPDGHVPLRSIGACVDITDRKMAEQALRDSEERFRAFFNNAAVGGGEVDESDHFIQVNEALSRITGYSTQELLCMTALDLTHPDDRGRVLAAFQEFKSGQRSWYELEKRTLRKDGQVIWVRVTAGLVRDSQGRPRRTALIIQDITEQKQAESDRQRLLDAERAARMESEKLLRLKDEFLSTVSHELRTPLGAIVGWTKLLEQGKAEAPKAIDVISQSASNLTQIVDDLLDMSRIMSGKISLKPERASIVEIIGKAIEAVQFAADSKDIQIEVQFDRSLDIMECDPTRVQQIVWNLLSNAIKFTPEEGHVFVTAQPTGRHIKIQVRDTGQGIAPEFLPHIFERFRQQDGGSTRKHGGLGIGLAIVRQLVELHGGTIEAESDGEGRGATFTVCLPKTQVRTSPAPPKRSRARPLPRPIDLGPRPLEGVRVLAIDDDPFSRELADRILTEAGGIVRTADSAKKAWEILDEYRPDVIVSDLGMPGDDGYVFVQKLRRTDDWRAGLPCVALTAFNRPEDRDRALRLGFDEHIGKPFEPSSLIVAAARLVHKQPTASTAHSRPGPSAASGPRSSHVLLAEDSKYVAEMMKEVLEQDGYRVSVVESIAGALEVARGFPIDILITDLRLKDGLAWDLLAKIREHHAIPGVLTSGYAEEAYITKSKQAGFDEYLVKPVDPDNLLAIVRHHVEALAGARS